MTIPASWSPRVVPAEQDDRTRDEVYRAVASVAAMVAGAVHVIVAPEHLAISWYVGGFFVAVAVGQLGLALALVRRLPTWVLLPALVANLGVVALYVASRTVDLTFLPVHDHAREHLPVAGGVGDGVPVLPGSHIEPVGFLDLLCLGAELVMLAMLVALLPARLHRYVTTSMLVIGVAAFGARAVGLLG